MKEILLNKDFITLVDDEDYDYLNQWRWCVDNGYVVRGIRNGKAVKKIYMHRLLLNPENDLVIDHIDGNKLNNQKHNLRICSIKDNVRNRKKANKKMSSKYKGVHYLKNNNTWQAYINNGKRIYLGSFKTEKEAAIAYNEAALIYHGNFAKLNIL